MISGLFFYCCSILIGVIIKIEGFLVSGVGSVIPGILLEYILVADSVPPVIGVLGILQRIIIWCAVVAVTVPRSNLLRVT